MNKELDKKLCLEFPVIFEQRNLDMTQTCMCWGFECSDGWYDIIRDLCIVIDDYVKNVNRNLELSNKEERIKCHATQVKEKFGTLRFYTDYYNDYINGAIRYAEVLSEHTCERCGKSGTINDEGWLMVRCPECLKEDEDRKEQIEKGWDRVQSNM